MDLQSAFNSPNNAKKKPRSSTISVPIPSESVQHIPQYGKQDISFEYETDVPSSRTYSTCEINIPKKRVNTVYINGNSYRASEKKG